MCNFKKKEMLTDEIYYADPDVLDLIKNDFDLIDDKGWYQLYQDKEAKTFWRLDKWDKYQEQVFVKLTSIENWTDFDDSELRITLLQNTKGIDLSGKCIWNNCGNPTLKGLVFCGFHAYKEMGIRK
jgi:hypothetical protein